MVCVRALCLLMYAGLAVRTGSPAYFSKQSARTHTICYAAASPH